MADGGLAADLGRPPVRGVRRRARSTTTGSSGRSAGGRPRNGISPRSPPRRARSSTRTPPGSTPGSTRIAAASASPSSSPARIRSRGPCSTRSPGARSRPGTSAGTWTASSSGSSPTQRLGDPARTDELFRGPGVRAGHRPDARHRGAGGSARRRRDRARDRAAAGPRRPTLTDVQAAAWRDVASIGDELLRLAGLDGSVGGLASDHGIGSNNWVVGAVDVVDRRRAARERPAPGHLDAVDLVRQRPPLRDGRARPARSTSPASASRGPGRRPGPQRPDRVGCDERRSRRPGPGHRDRRPGGPDPLPGPGRRVAPVHGPDRDRSRSPAARPVDIEVRETVHGPILNDVDDRLADSPLMALRWSAIHPAAAPGPDLRGDPGPQHGRRLR